MAEIPDWANNENPVGEEQGFQADSTANRKASRRDRCRRASRMIAASLTETCSYTCPTGTNGQVLMQRMRTQYRGDL